ncbi:MAG TPA: PIN domain-containing protein [Opitutaceae bacterium]|nr:PIN domain-containing protein [Opitutaceae bacterium]
MVLIDSSVWIEALRRSGSLEVKVSLEALLEAFEATLCSPIKLEVLGGARVQERKALAEYFDILPYDPMPESTWQEAIELSWKLRDAGVTVPWNDLLIACRAIALKTRLYSCDKHFEVIAQHAPLRLYRPGYGGRFEPETSEPGGMTK